jgi:hypothetical protein
MGSSPDHHWVPKSTPQRDRLYRFFTKSVGAPYTGMFVLFQGGACVGAAQLAALGTYGGMGHRAPTPEAHWGRGPFKIGR